jgi:hypothetical protein
VDVVGDDAGEETDSEQKHDCGQPQAVGQQTAAQAEHDHQPQAGEDLVRRQHGAFDAIVGPSGRPRTKRVKFTQSG